MLSFVLNFSEYTSLFFYYSGMGNVCTAERKKLIKFKGEIR